MQLLIPHLSHSTADHGLYDTSLQKEFLGRKCMQQTRSSQLLRPIVWLQQPRSDKKRKLVRKRSSLPIFESFIAAQYLEKASFT
eukprot:6315566-Amphidinium_carterae.2